MRGNVNAKSVILALAFKFKISGKLITEQKAIDGLMTSIQNPMFLCFMRSDSLGLLECIT